MRIAVTGAQGYLGAQITRTLRSKGHEVFELVRRPTGSPHQIPFKLGDSIDPSVFRSRGIESLIHVAYDFRQTDWESISRINIEGSNALFEAFKAGGGNHGVYISTIAAWNGCRSLYGKAKLQTEKSAVHHGFWVVRPGLIRGGSPGGIVGTMLRFVQKLPAVPVIAYGLRCLHPVGVDPLCDALSRMAIRSPKDTVDALVIAADPTPLSLDEVLREAITEQGLGRRLLIPCPWQAVWIGLRTLEFLGVSIGLRSDSVISLVNQDPNPRLRELSSI
jgi:nucleoside-diphosphate-sugar epimerase